MSKKPRRRTVPRPIPPDEVERIERLRVAGHSIRTIARDVGRNISTVGWKLRQLAIRDEGDHL